jgi:uncharacterized protein (TIGR02118 family)
VPWKAEIVAAFKAISCWSFPRPGEEEEFERHYWEVHVPLAAAIPGTVSLTLTRTDEGLEDAPPSYYRVAETVFESREALAAAMRTPQWEALRADAAEMHARFGVTLANGLGTSQAVELRAEA